MGDLGTLFNFTFMFASILIFGALAGYLSEKVGIVNIGIDGMMCVGALIFCILSSPTVGISSLGSWSFFIPMILTMLITMSLGLLHGFACIKLKGNHIISGTAINLFGLALATFLTQPLGPILSNTTYLQCGYQMSGTIAPSLYIDAIIIFGVTLLFALCLWVFMHKTKTGLRFRAVGENPNAIDTQGISVAKYQWAGVLLSSALAALAGIIFILQITSFTGNVQSVGYLALAILIAGAWNITFIVLFSFIFALFKSVTLMTVFTNIGLDNLIVSIIPYVATLLILMFTSKSTMPPEHSGIPFNREKR